MLAYLPLELKDDENEKVVVADVSCADNPDVYVHNNRSKPLM